MVSGYIRLESFRPEQNVQKSQRSQRVEDAGRELGQIIPVDAPASHKRIDSIACEKDAR